MELLHLAAENQATKCASILLYSAADVSLKSKAGVKALTLMVEKIPDAMDSLLNRAVSIEKYDPTNVKCELKLDFGAIVGYSETRGYSQRKGKTGGNGENGNVKARKEMQLLTLILDCSSSARKKILTHPLIAIFLYLKWRCVRTVFWLTILLHVVLLMLYTLYILDVYLISCPYRPKITEPAAVKAAKAEGNYLQSENSTYRAEFIKFSWFEFSPQLQELGTIKSNLYGEGEIAQDGCPLEIGPTVKSVLLLALTILMVTNEVFKMLPAPRSYWKRTNNRLQWTLFLFIFLTSWPVFMSHPNINFWQYQAAAFGLFLAWGLMLSQIGKFPILGLYVEILTKVLKNFGFFMVTYASLLMAFALAFCVLFPGNAPYSSIPLAILKVLMMMVGEVNYEDLFYGNEENPVGLTVSDIQGLQKDAELTRLSRQIGEISQLESFVFSKRVQSFLPGSFAAFLRESVLVVRPKYGNHHEKNPTSPTTTDYKDSSWYCHLRPNDPNDKSIPEDLKVAVLRIAAARHRTKRTNRCTKNFHRGTTVAPAATPLLEEYQRYASTNAGASGWLPPPYQRVYSRGIEPTVQGPIVTGTPLSATTGPPVPPWIPSPRTRLSSNASTIRDPPELTYFMKRLEEKIMDRMKIQMDTLYQKIEDKMMNIH
ncbi:Transient receptor potential channel pyrexia [Orchesella cincta]|uniref:Transient receptor potential channel pyrexia n=1 Tax=Orchesella cincta TaxID=48709 RepID=A0A1D2MYC5_ORCCI|nr:Transient receptor potential channel pyrexia [Orchesella cincta]